MGYFCHETYLFKVFCTTLNASMNTIRVKILCPIDQLTSALCSVSHLNEDTLIHASFLLYLTSFFSIRWVLVLKRSAGNEHMYVCAFFKRRKNLKVTTENTWTVKIIVIQILSGKPVHQPCEVQLKLIIKLIINQPESCTAHQCRRMERTTATANP